MLSERRRMRKTTYSMILQQGMLGEGRSVQSVDEVAEAWGRGLQGQLGSDGQWAQDLFLR